MREDRLAWVSGVEIAAMVTRREVTVTEVAEAFVERIARLNPVLNAYVIHDPETVLRDAALLDRRLRDGERPGPMFGVPYSLKEATDVAGLPSTGGMKPSAGHVATRDVAVARRLRDAGGLFLGKTNMPEAGYWGGTDGHLYGPTRNPWKLDRHAGGSSGGAAAAVAAGLCPIAEGSDGAGSVRIPASACGVYGFKPSVGRIPQEFLSGRHETWIAHGPLTRTVADAALAMDVMAGPDAGDPLSVPHTGERFLDGVADVDLRGRRIAWSPDLGLGPDAVDPEVIAICEDAVRAFEELGATVVEATPSWTDLERTMWESVWLPAYGMAGDALDWDNAHGEVDDQLIALVQESRLLTAVERARADVRRGDIARSFIAFMSDYDLLVSPTLATTAFPIGQFAPDRLHGLPLQRQLLGWLLTYPFNMTATPSASVPAGFTTAGLPVGLQLSGGHRDDLWVLQASAAFESARPWQDAKPSLAVR